MREKELWQAASRGQKTKYRVARLARANTRATARAVDPPPGNLFTNTSFVNSKLVKTLYNLIVTKAVTLRSNSKELDTDFIINYVFKIG